MARLSFAAVLLALAAAVNAQTTITNPFTSAGIPSLSDLPFCKTECAAVAQIQANWTGDYSSACTTTFANSLTSCMSCVANTSIGQTLLTEENRQSLATAINGYTSACQQAGSPVTIDLSSALASTHTATSSVATGTGTAITPSNTSAGSGGSNGAMGASVPFSGAAMMGVALVAAAASFF
ncbi:hypothetical protein FRC17_001573 [Serendipita sp. 399]|nr:hypothetical protein FRC17_001573 [Serendipita sp. 399]